MNHLEWFLSKVSSGTSKMTKKVKNTKTNNTLGWGGLSVFFGGGVFTANPGLNAIKMFKFEKFCEMPRLIFS